MNESTTSSPAADTLESLRAEHRRNKLALAVERQRQKLHALGGQAHAAAVGRRNALETAYYDPANFVDLTSYLGDGPFGYSLAWSPWLSTRADRDFGRDRPIFQTELDLAAFRGMARLLTAYNANAIGAVENLTSYVVGKGSIYKAAPNANSGLDVSSVKPIVAAVQRVIDHFVEINDWDCDLAEEKFQRSRVDGEFFEGLWHVGGGECHVRLVEPEQVTQPYTYREIEEWIGCDHRRVDWTFGVCADDEDAANVHGYYVQWTNRETDWDFLPGGSEPFYAAGSQNSWCQHFKCNVPRNVKRGVTDFMCSRELFDLSRKVLQNMGKATSLASAIAWVIQHAPGILQSQIQSFISQNADANYTQTTQSGTNTSYVKYYAGGTILHAPKGQEYKSAPGLENADAEINVVQAMLRSAAVRWAMPEHMISGDAGNNDYASILEAGSPFVKRGQRSQTKLAGHDRKVLWKVLEFACAAGVIRDKQGRPLDFNTLKRLVEIQVESCRVDVRNEQAETTRNETLKKNGVMSRQTWAAREGLDFEQEERNGLTDEAAQQPAGKQGDDGGETKPASEPSEAPHTPHAGQQRGSTESLADALENDHAPAGKPTVINHKEFKPGQFIPAADMKKATPAEKKKLKQQQAAAKSGGDSSSAPRTPATNSAEHVANLWHSGAHTMGQLRQQYGDDVADEAESILRKRIAAGPPPRLQTKHIDIDHADTEEVGKDTGDKHPTQVFLVEGHWHDPENPGSPPHRVFRWEQRQRGGAAIANGPWEYDRSKTIREANTKVDEPPSVEKPSREKPADVKSSGKSKAKVEVIGRTKKQVSELVQKHFGVALKDVPSLVGAPDGATVSTSVVEGNGGASVKIAIHHEAIQHCQRTLTKNARGEKTIHNDIFVVKADYQRGGIGSEIFSRQVEQSAKAGIARIETHAAREGGFNGYYTWPRLGYDQDIDDMDRGDAANVRNRFPGVNTVQDVMRTKEGREWWRQNGNDLRDATFDLAEGSLSRRIHETYMKERESRNG